MFSVLLLRSTAYSVIFFLNKNIFAMTLCGLSKKYVVDLADLKTKSS